MKIDLLINASRKAAIYLLRDFNELKHFKYSIAKIQKFLMHSQIRVLETVTCELQRYFPEHAIINASDFDQEQLQGSYIMIQAIDSISNIENMLPFFAITIFVVTRKNNITTQSVVMNFPALDKILYTSTAQELWIENYHDSHKIKGAVSGINNIMAIRNLNQDLIDLFNEQKIANFKISLDNVRVFGSNAYSLLAFASAQVAGCIIDDSSWIMSRAAELVSENCQGLQQKIGAFSVYMGRANPQKKILSFPR